MKKDMRKIQMKGLQSNFRGRSGLMLHSSPPLHSSRRRSHGSHPPHGIKSVPHDKLHSWLELEGEERIICGCRRRMKDGGRS